MTEIICICVGSDGRIPLWECPCHECTSLEYSIMLDDPEFSSTRAEFRHEHWPDHYPNPNLTEEST